MSRKDKSHNGKPAADKADTSPKLVPSFENVQAEPFGSVVDGLRGDKILIHFAVKRNRDINEMGASLSILYHELGRALLKLREGPYGAHGAWERNLAAWGIERTRATKAMAIAESYENAAQLAQLSVEKAYEGRSKKRGRSWTATRAIPEPLPATGELYQPANGIQCWCCDFRELEARDCIRPGSVRTIITDPPWGQEWLPQLAEFAQFCGRVLGNGGSLVAWYGQMHLDKFMEEMSKHLTYRWIMSSPLDREGLVTRNVPFVQAMNVAVVYSKGNLILPHPVRDVVPAGPKSKELHYWARSREQVDYLVESFTDKGDTILDPCAGSYLTAESCHVLGRKCLACDVDAACLEQAKTRFNHVNERLYDELREDAANNTTDDTEFEEEDGAPGSP